MNMDRSQIGWIMVKKRRQWRQASRRLSSIHGGGREDCRQNIKTARRSLVLLCQPLRLPSPPQISHLVLYPARTLMPRRWMKLELEIIPLQELHLAPSQ